MFKDAALAVTPKQKAKIVNDNVSKSDKEKAAELLPALHQPSKDITHGNSKHGGMEKYSRLKCQLSFSSWTIVYFLFSC